MDFRMRPKNDHSWKIEPYSCFSKDDHFPFQFSISFSSFFQTPKLCSNAYLAGTLGISLHQWYSCSQFSFVSIILWSNKAPSLTADCRSPGKILTSPEDLEHRKQTGRQSMYCHSDIYRGIHQLMATQWAFSILPWANVFCFPTDMFASKK